MMNYWSTASCISPKKWVSLAIILHLSMMMYYDLDSFHLIWCSILNFSYEAARLTNVYCKIYSKTDLFQTCSSSNKTISLKHFRDIWHDVSSVVDDIKWTSEPSFKMKARGWHILFYTSSKKTFTYGIKFSLLK